MSDDFDPSAVPVYPVARIALRRDEDGTMSAWLDDERIDCHGQEPREALIERLATRARQRAGLIKAIRAIGTDLHGATYELVVTAEGVVHELGSQGRQDRPTTLRKILAGTALGLLTAGAIAAGGLIAGSLKESGAAQARPTVTITAAAAREAELPQIPPIGWSSHAQWSSPSLERASKVAIHSSTAYTVAAADKDTPRRLLAVDIKTGRTTWAAEIPGRESLTAGPVLVEHGGTETLWVASSSRLLAWTTDGKEAANIELPDRAEASLSGSGPLITLDPHHVATVTGGHLVSRVLPAWAQPVGTLDGQLVASDSIGNLWRINSNDVAPDPHQVPVPAGARADGPGAVAITGDTVVFAFAAGGSRSEVTLRGYDLSARKTTFTTPPLPYLDGVTVAASGQWAVIDNRIVEFRTGRVTTLPDGWRTVSVGADHLWGTVDEYLLTAEPGKAPQLPTAPSPQGDHVVPVDIVGNRMLVLGSNGQDMRLYALTKTAR